MTKTLDCREATRLLLEDVERALPPAERLALQVHVNVCIACQRFVSQIDFMRRATRAWRRHSDSDGEGPGSD